MEKKEKERSRRRQQENSSRHPGGAVIDSLLNFSEESYNQELQPHEYRCYSGLEEAVCGWARVAPLGGVFLTQSKCGKLKQKEADNLTPLPADPKPSNAESSVSIAEQSSESHVGLDSLTKPMSLTQQDGLRSQVSSSAQQSAEWRLCGVMQGNVANPLIEETTEEERVLGETHLQPHHLPFKFPRNKSAKPQKNSHRPDSTVLPMKNFTLVPPIKPLHHSSKFGDFLCRGKNASGEMSEENSPALDKKSGKRGARVGTVARSDLPTHSPVHGVSSTNTVLGSFLLRAPRRCQVPVSSEPEMAKETQWAMASHRQMHRPLCTPTATFL